jgi:hypothetical protein
VNGVDQDGRCRTFPSRLVQGNYAVIRLASEGAQLSRGAARADDPQPGDGRHLQSGKELWIGKPLAAVAGRQPEPRRLLKPPREARWHERGSKGDEGARGAGPYPYFRQCRQRQQATKRVAAQRKALAAASHRQHARLQAIADGGIALEVGDVTEGFGRMSALVQVVRQWLERQRRSAKAMDQ